MKIGNLFSKENLTAVAAGAAGAAATVPVKKIRPEQSSRTC